MLGIPVRYVFLVAGLLLFAATPLLGATIGALGLLVLAAHIAASAPATVRVAVWTGWALRSAVAIAGITIVALPDSSIDALFFHDAAAAMSTTPLHTWLQGPSAGTNPYPWLLSALYRWTGASLFAGIASNVLLGTVVVRGIAAIADTLWAGRSATLAAWAAALFPTFILYSSVLLREMMILALIVSIAWGALRFWGTGYRFSVAALAAWGFAAVLLPEIQVGYRFIVPALLMAIIISRTPLGQGRRGSWTVVAIAIGWLAYRFAFTYGFFDSAPFQLPDLAGVQDFSNIEDAQDQRLQGRTAYPDWLTIRGPASAALLLVPRMFAFMFLPLPWQVSAPVDLVGVFDALLYMGLTVLALLSLRAMNRPRVAFIVVFAALTILIYSMGVSNVGTAVRHRAKAAVLLIVLASGPMANPAQRVVFWISGLGNGGAERQLVEVATRLHHRGRNVFVAASRGGARASTLLASGVPAFVPSARQGRLRSLLQCMRAAAGSATVVTFLYGPNLLGRLMRPLTGNRLVTSLRAIRFGSTSRHRWLRATSLADDAWTSNSEAARVEQERDGIVRVGRGIVIRNGVDMSSTVQPFAAGPFTWISVGRLRPEKDHATLLRAWALATRPEHSRLRIVGDGPQQAELEALAKRLGITGSVAFVGAIHHMDAEYHAAHALVLSSTTEGSPNCVLEAMAQGRPVVATNVGGTPETLGPGAGILVPPTDPQALADAMTRLMQMPAETRSAMGEAGRNHVQAHHEWERVVDQWEALLWP